MPLDPLAKRFLTMMAAASPAERARPSASERRQALAKFMQFARADVADVTGIDGVLPGQAGDLPYRLYAPADNAREHAAGFVFFHGGGMVAGSIETHDRVSRRWRRRPAAALYRLITASRRNTNFRPRSRMRSRPRDGFPRTPLRSASMPQSSWWVAIPPVPRLRRWFVRRACATPGLRSPCNA